MKNNGSATRRFVRAVSATAVIALSVGWSALPVSASDLPGSSTSSFDHVFSSSTPPSSVVALTVSGSHASVPCLTAATVEVRNFHTCDRRLAVPSGAPDALVLDDAQAGSSGSGIVNTGTESTSNILLAQTFSIQRGAAGAQTLWLVDGATSPTTIPGTVQSGGYGDASGGIANAILGVTFDASGRAATTNGASCPAVGWSSSNSTANQVVIRAGSNTTGNGFCFIASTSQPVGAVAVGSPVGSLSSSATDGWQRYVVAVLPPSVTHGEPIVEVSVDSGTGHLATVLAVRLPQWAWASVPATAHWGFSAVGSGTVHELHEWAGAFQQPSVSPPSAPQNLGVSWATPVNGKVSATVSFTPSLSDGGSPVTSYFVSAAGHHCDVAASSASSFSCTISSLPVARTVAVSVVAINSAGSSVPVIVHSSSSAMAQTISFSEPGAVTYVPEGLTLSATSTSSLPVSFSATGACQVAGTQLTFTALGKCSVTATQTGNAQYAAATPVTTSFTVRAAPATITVGDLSVTQDGIPHSVVASVSPAVSGLTIQYCLNALSGIPQCSLTAPTNSGDYVVTVTLTNPLYVATAASARLIVAPPAGVLAPELGGSTTPQSSHGASLSLQSAPVASGIDATATLAGFAASDSVVLSVVGNESLGTFVVPSTPAAMSNLLHGSTSATSVGVAQSVTASSPSALSFEGTVAFPNGDFPGGGTYIVVPVTTSGLVPGTTVEAVLHSTPIVLAASRVAADGRATVNIPLSTLWSGQSHTLFLNGTYQSSTIVAGTSAQTTIHIPQQLIARLAPGSTAVISGASTKDPTVFSTNFVALSAAGTTTTTTTTPTISAGGVTLSTYSPTAHPVETQKQITRVIAAVAVVAAAAGAAAAGASSSSGSSGGSGPDSTVGVQASFDLASEEREHWGDRSRLWRLVGHRQLDHFSRHIAHGVGHVSPLFSSSLADANYLRAIVGGLYFALPLTGLALGTWASVSTHAWAFPPSLALFVAILALGFLDSFSGLVAAAVVVGVAAVTGHITTLPQVVLAAVLGGVWFGLPLMVKSLRPFVREHPQNFDDWWRRGSDGILIVLFSGFLAYSLVGSLSSAAHADVPVSHHAATVAYIVMAVAAVRFLLALSVGNAFPKRLASVTMAEVPAQNAWARRALTAGQAIFIALLMQAFVGNSIVLLPLVLLPVMTGQVGRLLGPHLRARTLVHRLVPRGSVNTLFMSLVGVGVSHVLAHSVTSSFWLVTGQILIMMAVSFLYNVAAAVPGDKWPPSWPLRVVGIGIVALTILQVTGHWVH
jgi:hypothetical protein